MSADCWRVSSRLRARTGRATLRPQAASNRFRAAGPRETDSCSLCAPRRLRLARWSRPPTGLRSGAGDDLLEGACREPAGGSPFAGRAASNRRGNPPPPDPTVGGRLHAASVRPQAASDRRGALRQTRLLEGALAIRPGHRRRKRPRQACYRARRGSVRPAAGQAAPRCSTVDVVDCYRTSSRFQTIGGRSASVRTAGATRPVARPLKRRTRQHLAALRAGGLVADDGRQQPAIYEPGAEAATVGLFRHRPARRPGQRERESARKRSRPIARRTTGTAAATPCRYVRGRRGARRPAASVCSPFSSEGDHRPKRAAAPELERIGRRTNCAAGP